MSSKLHSNLEPASEEKAANLLSAWARRLKVPHVVLNGQLYHRLLS
jgi:hypothetical protein